MIDKHRLWEVPCCTDPIRERDTEKKEGERCSKGRAGSEGRWLAWPEHESMWRDCEKQDG